MATFNENTLDSYFKKQDWLGAANYLSSLKAATPQLQDELNNKIRELTIQGERQKALLQSMSVEQQAAFNFSNAYNAGTPFPNNSYTDKYNSLIDNLQAVDGISPGGRNVEGEAIKTLRIELNTDSEYNRYLSKLGILKEDIDKKDVTVKQDSSTGKWIIDIPKNNIHISEFYINALDLDTTYTHNTSAGAVNQTIPGDYSIKALTTSNIILDRNQFNSSNLYEAYHVIHDAQETKTKAIEEHQTVSNLEQMVVTPFLGHGHANAYKRMANGSISIDDYNKIVKERTDIYNRLLKQAGLENYKVYTTQEDDDDEKGKVFKEIENKDKNTIMEHILIAMDDDRLTYSAAMHEGEVGTYITISPATTKDKDIASGDYAKGMRIFIPGLFKSSCDESFNSDTKQMSVRDNADMKRWNYGKFLKNGEYVGYDKEMGAYMQTTDENGESIKVPIDEATILHKLNEENIINQSVSTLLKNIDENGEPLTYNKDGKTYTYDIEKRAQTLANVATNELYPKGSVSDGERLRHANDIYNTIMKQLTDGFYNQNKK